MSGSAAAAAKSKAKAKAKPSAPVLSYEKAMQMMTALLREYVKPSFQRKLHEAWDAAAGDILAQSKSRQATCLAVQGPILKKFGFEASRIGVHQSVQAFNTAAATRGYDDPEGDYKAWLVGWLVNPELQRSDPEREVHFARARGQKVVEKKETAAAANKAAVVLKPKAEEKDTPPLKLVHLNPDRRWLYGARMPGERAPSAFLALPSGGAEELKILMEYLREDPEGPFCGTVDAWPEKRQVDPDSRWGAWGFDIGANGKEQLLKADWHSVHKWGPRKQVFVPRFGELISMRQAPPRLLAFLEAFREVNMDIWNSIVGELEALKDRASEGERKDLTWLVDTLCQVFRERGFLGAIEAQVWWGPVRTPTRSHKDGITSLLHLSMTLGGTRSLRVGSFDNPWAQAPQPLTYNSSDFREWQEHQRVQPTGEPAPSQLWRENNVWDDEAWFPKDLLKVAMKTGDVYVSAPFVFEHGVMYERCDRTSPVIALQCRLAFRDAEAAERVNELRDLDMLRVATVVADCLARAGDDGRLRVPSMSEVKDWENRIATLPARLAAMAAGGRQTPFDLFSQVSVPIKPQAPENRQQQEETPPASDTEEAAPVAEQPKAEAPEVDADWLWTDLGVEMLGFALEHFGFPPPPDGPPTPTPGGPCTEEHFAAIRMLAEWKGDPQPDCWELAKHGVVVPSPRLTSFLALVEAAKQAADAGEGGGGARPLEASKEEAVATEVEAGGEAAPLPAEGAEEAVASGEVAVSGGAAVAASPTGARRAPAGGAESAAVPGEGPPRPALAGAAPEVAVGGEAVAADSEAAVRPAPAGVAEEAAASGDVGDAAVEAAVRPALAEGAEEVAAVGEASASAAELAADLLAKALPGPLEYEVVHPAPVSVRERPSAGARELRLLHAGRTVLGYPGESWLRICSDSTGGCEAGGSSSSLATSSSSCPTSDSGLSLPLCGGWVFVGSRLRARCLEVAVGNEMELRWPGLQSDANATYSVEWRRARRGGCAVATAGSAEAGPPHAEGGCITTEGREPHVELRGVPLGVALELRAVAHVAASGASSSSPRLRLPGPWTDAFLEEASSSPPVEASSGAPAPEVKRDLEALAEEDLEVLARAHPGKEAVLRSLAQLVRDGVVTASELPGAARLFAAQCAAGQAVTTAAPAAEPAGVEAH